MTDQEKIDVIQAQMDGKVVEGKCKLDSDSCYKGRTMCNGKWGFNFVVNDYRIKHGPKYTELSPSEAFGLLSRGKPIHARFGDDDGKWIDGVLTGADYTDVWKYRERYGNTYSYCSVTEEVYSEVL